MQDAQVPIYCIFAMILRCLQLFLEFYAFSHSNNAIDGNFSQGWLNKGHKRCIFNLDFILAHSQCSTGNIYCTTADKKCFRNEK